MDLPTYGLESVYLFTYFTGRSGGPPGGGDGCCCGCWAPFKDNSALRHIADILASPSSTVAGTSTAPGTSSGILSLSVSASLYLLTVLFAFFTNSIACETTPALLDSSVIALEVSFINERIATFSDILTLSWWFWDSCISHASERTSSRFFLHLV